MIEFILGFVAGVIVPQAMGTAWRLFLYWLDNRRNRRTDESLSGGSPGPPL